MQYTDVREGAKLLVEVNTGLESGAGGGVRETETMGFYEKELFLSSVGGPRCPGQL